MRVLISTDFDEFEADTISTNPNLDFDGRFSVLTEFGDRLVIKGWMCTVEVLDAEPRPAGWYQVDAYTPEFA